MPQKTSALPAHPKTLFLLDDPLATFLGPEGLSAVLGHIASPMNKCNFRTTFAIVTDQPPRERKKAFDKAPVVCINPNQQDDWMVSAKTERSNDRNFFEVNAESRLISLAVLQERAVKNLTAVSALISSVIPDKKRTEFVIAVPEAMDVAKFTSPQIFANQVLRAIGDSAVMEKLWRRSERSNHFNFGRHATVQM